MASGLCARQVARIPTVHKKRAETTRLLSESSAAVGCTNPDPAIANLLVVHARIIGGGLQIEHLRRQSSDRAQDRIRGDHAVMLRGDQRNAGIDQGLLRVEHVERGSLSGLGFFTHAVQRDFGSLHLGLRRGNLRLARNQLAPRGHRVGAGLVASRLEV